jgi:polyisoprenoid-binding protein YceI
MLCVLLLASCASAPADDGPTAAYVPTTLLAPDPNVSHDAGAQTPGRYSLDPRHTSVLWRVRHWGLSPYTGRFDTVAGRLMFDAANPSASTVEVRIPVNSISTGLVGRDGQRGFDNAIAAWLGGEAHPNIEFASTSVEVTDDTHGVIHGNLTFNGQTHPIDIQAQFEGGRLIATTNRQVIAFTGRALFDWRQWNPTPIENSASPGAEVELIISAEFVYNPQPAQPAG